MSSQCCCGPMSLLCMRRREAEFVSNWGMDAPPKSRNALGSVRFLGVEGLLVALSME